MSEPTQNKYKQGDLVYFVGLDNRCQWAVFGTTVKEAQRVNGVWKYNLNTQPFMVRRDETGLYRDYEAAKMKALFNSQHIQFPPKRGGRKTSCDKTSYKSRPSLF